MSEFLNDYIKYRIEKSAEALNNAKLLANNGSWNAVVNRLYYSSYYMVTALLLKHRLPAQTHSGVKALFNLNFIKPGLLPKVLGKLYGDLLDWRHKGDYGDMFDFDRLTVEPLIDQVGLFLASVIKLINVEQ